MNENPKSLKRAMDLFIPLEIRSDGKRNFQRIAGDGLDVRAQIKTRELVNVLMEQLAIL